MQYNSAGQTFTTLEDYIKNKDEGRIDDPKNEGDLRHEEDLKNVDPQ